LKWRSAFIRLSLPIANDSYLAVADGTPWLEFCGSLECHEGFFHPVLVVNGILIRLSGIQTSLSVLRAIPPYLESPDGQRKSKSVAIPALLRRPV